MSSGCPGRAVAISPVATTGKALLCARCAGFLRDGIGKLDLQSQDFRTLGEERAIAEQIERRQDQLTAAQPCGEGDVGTDARGSPDVSARNPAFRTSVFRGVGHQSLAINGTRSSRLCGCRSDRLLLRLVFLGVHLFPISRFFGVSTLVGFRSHNATISTPCLVISGGVKRPTGVLSRSSRSGPGMSAEVLMMASRIAAFCIDLK